VSKKLVEKSKDSGHTHAKLSNVLKVQLCPKSAQNHCSNFAMAFNFQTFSKGFKHLSQIWILDSPIAEKSLWINPFSRTNISIHKDSVAISPVCEKGCNELGLGLGLSFNKNTNFFIFFQFVVQLWKLPISGLLIGPSFSNTFS